ncbi:divalent-cation tolerance protein CutA [Aerosakkonema funiforme]|uniref:divalent-cation tolerance protein CutA n=1 Tax=Aerosakkonema funiforme TaxID=1246630 RepID=UPI0035B79D20
MDKESAKVGYGVVLVTAGTREEAEAIAQNLVETKLAACVSLFPIKSILIWSGQLQKEEEWQLLIKTDLAKFEILEAKIRELISYEVPEIIALPLIAGFAPYLAWISEQVN